MPELPEVETIRKTLKTVLIGKEVKDITIYWPKIIQKPEDTNIFKETLRGQILEDIKRKGKFLIFEWTNIVMVSHLRMEGKYGIFDQNEAIKNHTHVIFHFSDHTELRYNDVRKFGTMHLFHKGHELTEKPLSLLAPDPFEPDFSYNLFEKKVLNSSRVIKNILLDQTVIAGLGNIYVDETLFLSKVHPLTLGNNLSKNQIRAIFDAAVITLEKAIAEGGTTIRSYVNTEGEIGMFQQQLNVYKQEGKPCKKCSAIIEKIKVNGRGTHYCRMCQS